MEGYGRFGGERNHQFWGGRRVGTKLARQETEHKEKTEVQGVTALDRALLPKRNEED